MVRNITNDHVCYASRMENDNSKQQREANNLNKGLEQYCDRNSPEDVDWD